MKDLFRNLSTSFNVTKENRLAYQEKPKQAPSPKAEKSEGTVSKEDFKKMLDSMKDVGKELQGKTDSNLAELAKGIKAPAPKQEGLALRGNVSSGVGQTIKAPEIKTQGRDTGYGDVALAKRKPNEKTDKVLDEMIARRQREDAEKLYANPTKMEQAFRHALLLFFKKNPSSQIKQEMLALAKKPEYKEKMVDYIQAYQHGDDPKRIQVASALFGDLQNELSANTQQFVALNAKVKLPSASSTMYAGGGRKAGER